MSLFQSKLFQSCFGRWPSSDLPDEGRRSRRPMNQDVDFMNLDAQPIQENDLGPNDIIIAVMGPTGAGKSTFISTAIGWDGGVGHGLESFTGQVSAIRVTIMEMQVVLVDTPGFDDTYLPDLDILKMISDWLRKTSEAGLELSGLLYMRRISDDGGARAPPNILNMFRKLCGEGGFKKVILTTTMWPDADDHIATSAAIAREDELISLYWSDMIKGGSRTLRFKNTQQSAWYILVNLISLRLMQQNIPIQHELVTLRRYLPNTEARRQLYGTIEELAERHRYIHYRIREELRKTQDTSIIQVLVAGLHEICKEQESAMKDMQQLNRTLARHGRLHRLLHGTPRQSRRVPRPIITLPFEERSHSLLRKALKNRDQIAHIRDLEGDEAEYLISFLDLFHREEGTLTTEEHEDVRLISGQLRAQEQRAPPRKVNYERVYSILLSISFED